MADDILKNIWNELSSKGKTDSEFDAWKTNVYSNEDVQNNVYGYLKDNGYTDSEFSDWKANALPAKTTDSASADPAVESNQNSTDSKSEDGSSGFLSKALDLLKTLSPAINLAGGVAESFIDLKKAIEDSGSNETGPNDPSGMYSIARGLKENPKGFFGNAIEGIPGAANTVAKILVDDLILDGREALLTLGMEGYSYLEKGRSATEDEKEIISAVAKATNTYMSNTISHTSPNLTRKSTDAITKKLNEYIAVQDNTISEEILKGSKADWGEIGGRIFAGALTSAPYTLASLHPYTAAVLGLSIANDKFVQEYEKNPDKELWKIAGNAATTGGIEMIDSLISRRMFRAKGLLKSKNFKGNAEKALNEMNKGIGRKIMDVVGIGAKESLTEMGQSIATKINDELWLGDSKNISEVYENSKSKIIEDVYEIIDEGIIGGFSGGGIAGIASATRGSATLKARAEFLLMPASERKAQKELYKKIVEKNNQIKLAKEEGNQKKADVLQGLNNNLIKRLNTISIKNQMVLDNLQGKDLVDYAKNVDKINALGKGEKTQGIENDINNLVNENQTIFDKVLKENFGENMAFTKAAAAQLNMSEGLQILNSDSAYEQAIANSFGFKTFEEYVDAVYEKRVKQTPSIKRGDIKRGLKGSNGVFVGKGGVLINSKQAKKFGAIGVGSHEILHPILSALVGDAKAQKSIVLGFEKVLSKEQSAWVKKELKNQGKVEGTTEYYNEYITVFSEGLVKNRINFERNSFGKIKDWVTKTFIDRGFDNIDFVSGRGVYNFMKSYSESTKSGKLSEKTTEAISKRETETGVKVSEAGAVDNEAQFSKTLTPEQDSEVVENIAKNKERKKASVELAIKYGRFKKDSKGENLLDKKGNKIPDPPMDPVQKRLEDKIIAAIKPILDKFITSRTKALYDPIADDAKRNVTRQEFKESMRTDLEVMTLNEYDGSQELEKFIINRGYLRANNLAKRLGIESQEDGGIKSDVDAAKDIVATEDTQSIDRSGNVERGQATFDQLDIVDDKLISEIESELSKELKMRAAKGTLSEMISVKKGRETYFVTWLEDYVNKQLFKKILKKWGAIGEKNGVTVIPPGYIDFLNSKEVFDIVTKALPIRTIKKSYAKLFKIEKVGREKSAEGNPIFKIAPTDKKTFLQYFLDGKKNTILERQKQLAREVITPVVKEVVANYATEENLSNLKEIQELAPKESSDIKSSIIIAAKINDLQSKLDKYKGENSGFDIIQFSKQSIDSYSDIDINSIREASGLPSTTPKPFVLVEAIVQILRDTISPTATKLNRKKKILREKLGEDLFIKLENDFLYAVSDAYELKKQINEYGLGTAAEQIVWDVYNKLPGIKVLSSRPKGYSGDIRPDLIIQNIKTKKRYIIEIKANKNARLVTFDVQNYASKDPNVTRLTENSTDSNSIVEQLKKDAPANKLKGFLAKVNTYFKDNNLELEKDDNGNIIIDKDILDILLDNVNLYTASVVNFKSTNESLINDIYKNKDVSVISFVDIGNFNIKGVDSMYDLPIFKADIGLRGYLKQQPIANTNNVKLRFKIIAERANAATMDKLAEASTTPATSAISIKRSSSPTLISFSKTLNEDFNNIIEGATGIKGFKVFSEAKGKVRGRDKGKYKFFIPPSADDFAGLLGRLLGKGKKGDANAAWLKENLFDPFAKGIRDFEAYKQQTTHMVKSLKKRIKNVPNGLSKINETGFTNEAAVRVYLWVKNGYDISGLSKTDQKDLIKIIEDNKALKDFANELDQTFNGYPEPNNDWLAGTVTTDIINMVNTSKRAEFLTSWQENSDIIFSDENINKLRAAYGDNYIEALQDMLYRMKTGRNRPSGANKLTNKFMNWVNDSVGTIMFFNTRSALLQTLSIANFINWGDNNPAKAAIAFANQKQFWSDFAMLFNSDFLKQRRSGLKNDVNADDIASAAESATNKSKAVLASLLKMGFLPTQMADSFAIAMGGASFIRNRINKYTSEGMDTKAAEEQAFLDFQEVAEETQQSSRPDRISQQQASPLGRIILAFANTPMQYMRLTKKAFLDLKNGRGDAKTNISKIVYYTFVQNIIFSSLQAALFALAFEDEEDEVTEKREIRIANSMLDSILRGVGIYGAIASTGKNIIMEIDKQSKKDRPDFTQAAIRSLDLSPPLSSKVRKAMSAGRAFSYSNVRDKMTGYGLDNPAFYAVGQIVSATTNIPLDRAIKKADNLRVAVDNDTKLWQSIALSLGYSQWDLGLVETSSSKKKSRWGSVRKWKRSTKENSNW